MLKVLKKSFVIIVVSVILCHLMTIHTENCKKAENAELQKEVRCDIAQNC